MNLLFEGNIAKMQATLNTPVSYQLPIAEQLLDMNVLLGRDIVLKFSGLIHCIHCGRKTKKSFSQGFCYPCMTKLAQCDSCIMSPEKCHYAAGTCREPEWGDTHCMVNHIVYLANSSGLKVGITRATQLPTRWIDQGAVQALPIFRVNTRLLSGLVEVVFKTYVADKTNWRTMLKNHVQTLDLIAERDRLLSSAEKELSELIDTHGLLAIQKIEDAEVTHINFPVLEYPTKVTSLNLDKTPEVNGKLMGIKGQYLILDTGVINLRKYTGYYLEVFTQ